jgi:hypothetical protein
MAKLEARFEKDSSNRGSGRYDQRDADPRDSEDVGRDVGRGIQDAWGSTRDVWDSSCRLLSDLIVGVGQAFAPRNDNRSSRPRDYDNRPRRDYDRYEGRDYGRDYGDDEKTKSAAKDT